MQDEDQVTLVLTQLQAKCLLRLILQNPRSMSDTDLKEVVTKLWFNGNAVSHMELTPEP